MFEGFPSGPNDEDEDYVPPPMAWWEKIMMVGGMSLFIMSVLTLLKSCSENKCPF
jgi:hypothetical protein